MAAMMLQPAVVGRFCWFQDLQFLFILNFGWLWVIMTLFLPGDQPQGPPLEWHLPLSTLKDFQLETDPPSKVKWGFHSRVAAVTRSYRTWQMLLVCPCRPVRSAMERFSETFMISNQLATRWCQGWHDLVGLTASLILAMGSTDRDALCWDVMMHSYKKYHSLGFWCLVQICWSSEFMSESLLGLSPSTACLVPLTDDISPVATL